MFISIFFCYKDLEAVIKDNAELSKVITEKIPENTFILRSERQKAAAVLVDAIITALGTR